MSTNAPRGFEEGSLQIPPGTVLPGPPPAGKCSGCAALRKRIEDLEGALEGAHNIIRQQRDKDSKGMNETDGARGAG